MRRRIVSGGMRGTRELTPARVAAGDLPAPPGGVDESVAVGFRALPAVFWLAMIMTVSVAHRLLGVASGVGSPWVFPDEVIYAELGRSLADGNWLALRDDSLTSVSLGVVYPLLLAPVYALASDLKSAHELVQVVNALAMSSAAVPAYLLGRRLVTPGKALLAAGFAVALPAMAHVATVMTENVFYPLFLWFALALVRCLERPTGRRQLGLLALAVVAALTRAQGFALVPAIVTAIGLSACFDARAGRGGRATLARYRVTWLVGGLSGLALGAFVLLRGGSPTELVGIYADVFDDVRLAELPRTLLSHVAMLDLTAGVVPFAGAIVFAAAVLRRATRAEEAFLAATASLTVWLVIVAAAFATQPLEPPRIQERYLFYGAPLLFVCLLAALGKDSRRLVLGASVVVATLLPATLPFAAVLTRHAHSSSPSLIPWQLASPRTALLGITALAATLAATLVIRRRSAVIAPVAALVYVVGLGLVVDAVFVGRAEVRRERALGPNATWIDDAVGSSADVTVVWSGHDRAGYRGQRGVWLNEFFNTSVRRVYSLAETKDSLPTGRLVIDYGSHSFRDFGTGAALRADYILADRFLRLGERVVATDPSSGMRLYAVGGVATVRSPAVCRRVRPWAWGGDACAGRELARRLPGRP